MYCAISRVWQTLVMHESCSTHGGDEKWIANFTLKPEGKRPFWRQHRQEYDIKMDLSEVVCEAALNRVKWWDLVSMVMNTNSKVLTVKIQVFWGVLLYHWVHSSWCFKGSSHIRLLFTGDTVLISQKIWVVMVMKLQVPKKMGNFFDWVTVSTRKNLLYIAPYSHIIAKNVF